ncbi:MAG: hypothetical protein IPG17_29355, partial [Sandaracinaceae bacterium]|nr:hypothetical protein [Sandaracinaceae bacterium]
MNAAQLAGELPGAGATLLHELLFHTLAAPADVRAVRERFAAEDGRNAPVEPPPPPDPFADVPPAWQSTVEVVELGAHAGTSGENMHFQLRPGLRAAGPAGHRALCAADHQEGGDPPGPPHDDHGHPRLDRGACAPLVPARPPTVRVDGFDVQPVEASPDPLRVRSYGG